MIVMLGIILINGKTMNTVTLLQNDSSEWLDHGVYTRVSKHLDNEDNDGARSITGSVAAAVHYLESKGNWGIY
jgi:hypothetical protein